MVKNENTRSKIWWLANGEHSHSRQPSFAPATARPVVTTSYYGFGWDRGKSCFTTTSRHGIIGPINTKEYQCDFMIAVKILWQCTRKDTLHRFFGKPEGTDDAAVFEAGGYMFSISLRGCSESSSAEASLQFYAPEGKVQSIHLHNGMTSSFRSRIAGMKLAGIRNHML